MPEAWPSIRSTARWVLLVLVGPRTAMSREASPRAGERFMPVNVEDAGPRRKPRPPQNDPACHAARGCYSIASSRRSSEPSVIVIPAAADLRRGDPETRRGAQSALRHRDAL